MSEAASPIEPDTKISLGEQIWKTLEKSEGREFVNERRRRRQELILMRLPPDFEMEMKAFAANAEIRTEMPLERQVAGEIFENLVRSDSEICPKPETKEARLLRSILRDPEIYGLQEKGIDERLRNPDVAQINEEGKIVGAVEVKAGRIDFRGSQQLGIFKSNLVGLVAKLETIDQQTLQDHGLAEIANNLDKLQVADDFAITLAVPIDLYNGGPDSLLKADDFKPSNLEIARGRVEKCKIKQSPFSRQELRVVTGVVMNWLNTQKT